MQNVPLLTRRDDENLIDDVDLSTDVSTTPTINKFSTTHFLTFFGMLSLISVFAISSYRANLEFTQSPSTDSKSSFILSGWDMKEWNMDTFLDGYTLLQSDEIIITATNEYGQFDKEASPYPWMWDVYGTQLCEPYKNTTLTISGAFHDANAYTFEWYINGYPSILEGDINDDGILVGEKVMVKFTQTGRFNVTVKAVDSEGRAAGVFMTVNIVKYVKRELRSLTVEDRDKMLDAMATLWTYDTEEGREIYGGEYTSLYDYVAYHSLASNDIRCDQFHEGSGFISHHLALENSFEGSMRSVDPSVTLHYWDFTIEGQAITDAGEIPSYMLQITPFLSDEWFGSVDENSHIQDSRWAHALMPMAKNDDMTSNSYGFIRSYWNNNPDEEISRHLFDACGTEPVHKAIPDCPTHYVVLNAADMKTFQVYSPSDGHGPLHVQLGGMWGGCTTATNEFLEKWGDLLDQNITTEEIEAMGYDVDHWKWGTGNRRFIFDTAVMGEYFHIYRSLWRSHMCSTNHTAQLLKCPEYCSLDTPFEECACEVTDFVNGDTGWEDLYGCMLNEENREFFDALMPEEFRIDMTTYIATANVLEGEMIESASTADPFFWLIHPCIERLLHAKRLAGVTHMGGFNVTKWDPVDGSNETWFSYSYYSQAEGQNPTYPEAYTCVGHAAEDQVLPGELVLMPQQRKYADANGDGIISNWEYILAIDPNNVDGNDYVFDHFKWDHCSSMDV